ncbi:long-chain-fatty-acid--CoA ligase ACSBG2 isoform X2 [Eptesicus fuscus]|uniref:long-chain-fatty-acid--CoA ligase ACSBG2 isoform X2 n=1 Tax=Eptesicus fuscus TaxID=29078 RepID=UPI00101A691E|nr:long-chain-fatty-acid--CoA ligase ACSBG2 isoform X2 [Eptesicus fuscus]
MTKTKEAKPPSPGLWTIRPDGEVILRLSKHGPGHEPPLTIPEYFRESVNRFGTYSAVASKNGGKWEVLTYNQYFEACRKAAKALLKLGLERFHGVGILGFNSVEWFIASLGTILAGGLCVGIYATNSAEACQYVITQAKVNILMVENDLQLQKILSIPQNKLGTLKAIVQYKMPMNESNKSNLYSWDDFMELANTVPDPQLDQIIASQKANQCAMLIYTSGTTGNPKGVMLSHDNGTLVNTLQEVKPTAFLGVPRIWEKIQAKIKESCAKSSNLKNKVFSWARTIGLKINTKRMQGLVESPMSYHVAKTLVFNRVKNSIGFDHCHIFISGAAPLSPETAEFFLSLDIPIGEMYGMSETSGPHTVCAFDNLKMLSCGKITSGCKNMLYQQTSDGIGEVCMWGRHVFMGYLEKQEETTEVIDEEGWLHSGDLGLMDNQGFLYITGRIKEMLITAGGENVAPVPIENRVKEKIPIVSNALLVGDKSKFLSILLTLKCEMDETTGEPLDTLNWEAIRFCQELGSQASTVPEIVELQDPLVYSAIQKGIDAVNQEATSNAQKIQKWVILEKDFSIYGGELGPTAKIKRNSIIQKYRKQIENLYQ